MAWRSGRGWVSYGESCYVAAVKAWFGLVRCVMVCRGGQGKARFVGSSWVTVGRGGHGTVAARSVEAG